MKNLFPILVAAILASILTAGGLELLRTDDAPTNGDVVSPGAESSLVADPSSYASLESRLSEASMPDPRVDDLTLRVQDLERLVASLDPSRGVVVTREDAEAMASPEAREFVLDVLAQKEEQERLVREAEQRQRNEERLLREADRIAEAVGLGPGQKDDLFGILLEESSRRETMRDAMREGGWENREQMGADMRALNDWKEQELAQKFGTDLASQIDTWVDENSRGRGRMGGMGGGRGGTGGGRGGR